MRENEIKIFFLYYSFRFKCVKQDFIYKLFLKVWLKPINIFYEDGILNLKKKNNLLILMKFSRVFFTTFLLTVFTFYWLGSYNYNSTLLLGLLGQTLHRQNIHYTSTPRITPSSQHSLWSKDLKRAWSLHFSLSSSLTQLLHNFCT